jgi:phage FluMu gp28-like protein
MEEAISEDAILSRDPAKLPAELPRGADIPEDLDPLAEGVLMRHQGEWLEDDSDLKVCAKGRRTGITFAEALDDTLIASAARSAGGQNVFYIGDTKDKGREFIGYVKHFAYTVAKEVAAIEDSIFIDEREDGTTAFISGYRISFASGFRVEALSSRPENIRGLQGTVVIDEAAFHKNVNEVLDAVNALLIWGGKIRVISSHNGVLNAFNQLCLDAQAKKVPFSYHCIPFQAAIDNGLFRKVCEQKGEPWTQEAQDGWEAQIRGAYGTRTAKMKQELDAIPAESEGAALTRVLIERSMSADLPPVQRWDRPDDFRDLPDDDREAEALAFCIAHLRPILNRLDKNREHVFGEDFARSGDKTAIIVFEIGQDLVRRAVLTVELKNIPFDQQRDILFYIVDRLPRMTGGAMDATGNGSYLAEKAGQRYGESVKQLKLNEKWYSENMLPYIEAFSQKTLQLVNDADVLADHQALAYVNGIIKIPKGHSSKGADGFDRHGDTAIAAALGWFASLQEVIAYGYQGGERPPEGDEDMRGHNGGPPMNEDDFDSDLQRNVSVGLRGRL